MPDEKTIAGDLKTGLTVCLNCGYKRGFHVTIVPGQKDPMIILICPECGTKYDLNWSL
jgi:hypothetical protein